MTRERYNLIMADLVELMPDEIAEGWHFCAEFDGLLVKGDPTQDTCGRACIEWMRSDNEDIIDNPFE